LLVKRLKIKPIYYTITARIAFSGTHCSLLDYNNVESADLNSLAQHFITLIL